MFKIRKMRQLGPSRESVWSSFANDHGGSFQVGGDRWSLKESIDPTCRISLHRDGFDIQISSIISANASGARNTYVRFCFPFSTQNGEYITALEKRIFHLLPLPFLKIVSSGNRKLDETFSFFSTNPQRVAALFSDEDRANFLLTDPTIILNLGRVRRVHTAPKPKGNLFLLDRIGDIRRKEKLNQYLEFCLRCARSYRALVAEPASHREAREHRKPTAQS